MQWSDVIRTRETKELRQFAGLCLAVGSALVVWRLWRGGTGWSASIAGLFLIVGAVGAMAPRAISWIYTGWMTAVFPIGWTISRLVVAAMFYLLFTPVALFFRVTGRDALRVHRQPRESHWVPKRQPDRMETYLRQY